MDTLDRSDRLTLEQQVSRDPSAQQIKTMKTIINSQIDAMLEIHEILLKAAATSSEPDKILPASKVLIEAIAMSAKV